MDHRLGWVDVGSGLACSQVVGLVVGAGGASLGLASRIQMEAMNSALLLVLKKQGARWHSVHLLVQGLHIHLRGVRDLVEIQPHHCGVLGLRANGGIAGDVVLVNIRVC